MITWEKVIESEEIVGTPNAFSYTTNYGSAGITRVENWFYGIDQETYTEALNEITPQVLDGSYEGFGEEGYASITLTYQNGVLTRIANGGSSFYESPAYTVFILSGGIEDEGPAGNWQSSDYNSDWSRASVNLKSWEPTTITDYVGTITTIVPTFESRAVTTSYAAEITTTNFLFPISRIRTTETPPNSTLQTWTQNTYDTTFGTGKTTAVAYSSFRDFVPIVFENNNLQTKKTAIAPASFYEKTGTNTFETFSPTISSPFQQKTSTITTTSYVSNGYTATADGPLLKEGRFPSLIIGSNISNFNTATTGITYVETMDGSTYGVAGTKTFTITKNTTVLVNFLSSIINPIERITTTVTDWDDLKYLSTSGNSTTLGGYVIGAKNRFVTEGYHFLPEFLVDPKKIIAANIITLGVRAQSSGAVGGGVDDTGVSNYFYPHTNMVFLPATLSLSNITFRGNSFTKINEESSFTSTFDITGIGTTIWENLPPFTRSNTVIGGPIEGNAVIFRGSYSTFAEIGSGLSNVETAQTYSWNNSSPTTAFVQNVSVETFDPIYEELIGGALLPYPYSPITTVIDDY